MNFAMAAPSGVNPVCDRPRPAAQAPRRRRHDFRQAQRGGLSRSLLMKGMREALGPNYPRKVNSHAK
jgi:hypothetical protein